MVEHKAFQRSDVFRLVTIVTWLILIKVTDAAPVCGPNQFWSTITETCWECSVICDPPGRHVKDCPRLCKAYTGPSTTTTTTTTTTTKSPPTTTTTDFVQKQSQPKEPDREISPITWQTVVLPIVVGVVINIVIGLALYKKRESLKKYWPGSVLRAQLSKKDKKTIEVEDKKPVEVENKNDYTESLITSVDHPVQNDVYRGESKHDIVALCEHKLT